MDIRTIKRRAAALGATVQDDRHTIYVDAPEGTVWQSEGGAVLCAPCAPLGIRVMPGWRQEACADLYERMANGLVPDERPLDERDL